VSGSCRTLDTLSIINVGARKVIMKSLIFLIGFMVNNEMIEGTLAWKIKIEIKLNKTRWPSIDYITLI